MLNVLINLYQFGKYGVLKHQPNIDFSQIPGEIRFNTHYDAKHDVHWIDSDQLPEFYVTGKTTKELVDNIHNTLLVYYDVPAYFAKRMSNNGATATVTNRKTGENESITVNVQDEVNKVLA